MRGKRELGGRSAPAVADLFANPDARSAGVHDDSDKAKREAPGEDKRNGLPVSSGSGEGRANERQDGHSPRDPGAGEVPCSIAYFAAWQAHYFEKGLESMTTKMNTLRNFLKTGEYSLAQLRDGTGLSTNILSVYLNGLEKKGELVKSGIRRDYRYSIRAVQAQESQPASDYDSWVQGGADGGGTPGSSEEGQGATQKDSA